MSRLLSTLLLSSLCVSTLSTECAAEPQKYALLVGVTKYDHARMNDRPLRYPEADAAAVEQLLAKCGYKVDVLLGERATRAAVLSAFEQAARQGNTEGVVFIGLFGHGVQYAEDAYFCPFDAGLRKVLDSQGQELRDKQGRIRLEPDPQSLVALKDVLDTLAQCGAGNKVIFADCCREDPSAARGRAFGSELKVSDLPAGTAALFSCSRNEQAFEHDEWGHGAFTRAFLDEAANLAAQGAVRAATLSDRLTETVQTLVQQKGTQTQTVNPLIHGGVDLRLTAAIARPMAVPSTPVPQTPSLPQPTPREMQGTQPGELRRIGGDPALAMHWCPAGTFQMGSTPEERRSVLQQHMQRYGDEPVEILEDEARVTVQIANEFWMTETEITQKVWQTVMRTTPWKSLGGVRSGDDYPAVYIDWNDAQMFCERLTERERAAGRIRSDWHFRLPTEAEWEYACRAGTTSTYNGEGNGKLSDYAWYRTGVFDPRASDAGQYQPQRVGQKQPNRWGLRDMHGNVDEWCRDAYLERVPGGHNPLVAGTVTADHVVRGGDSASPAAHSRSAARRSLGPSTRNAFQGFRIVLCFEPQPA